MALATTSVSTNSVYLHVARKMTYWLTLLTCSVMGRDSGVVSSPDLQSRVSLLSLIPDKHCTCSVLIILQSQAYLTCSAKLLHVVPWFHHRRWSGRFTYIVLFNIFVTLILAFFSASKLSVYHQLFSIFHNSQFIHSYWLYCYLFLGINSLSVPLCR